MPPRRYGCALISHAVKEAGLYNQVNSTIVADVFWDSKYGFTELYCRVSRFGYGASAELMETITEQMEEERSASVTYLKGNIRR